VSSSVVSRETVRDALTAVFSAALVGSGKPAQVMYGYKAGDFQRQTPVVVLTAAGSDRMQLRPLPNANQVFYFELHLFTLYAVVKPSDNSFQWTDAQSEDNLDALEKAVSDVIVDYSDMRRTPHYAWKQMFANDRTIIDEQIIGNDVYRHEQIDIAVVVT